jgi:hypothetical protein
MCANLFPLILGQSKAVVQQKIVISSSPVGIEDLSSLSIPAGR